MKQLVSKSENVDFSTASTSDALTLQRSNPGDSSLMVNPSPVVEEVVSPSTTSTASSADALGMSPLSLYIVTLSTDLIHFR